ncbi:MAG TPA: hypothetical protein VGK17_09555 [Propionicimonas sp.]|jgi:hypothetical protein
MPPRQSAGEARLRAQVAAHSSWAATPDRSARTAPARRALDQKFIDQAGGDLARAESLRKAHYARLALASVRARRLGREYAAAADAADAELNAVEGS